MRTLNELTHRTDALERAAPGPGRLTIEKTGGIELVKWGKLIVKILRGGSFDDL